MACLQSMGDLLDDQQSTSPVFALCEVSRPHMSTVSTWQSMQACDVTGQYGITRNDMVFRPCRDDVRQVAANPGSHTPRWEKRKDLKKCCVKECQNDCFANTKTTDRNTMKKPGSSIN